MTLPILSRTSNTSISTEELSSRMGEPGLVVVDVRASAAYNGWRLQGEARGGHITGAVSLPLSWTEQLSEPDLETLLDAKGIRADRNIVVYGARRDDSVAMARLLRAMAFQEVRTYDAGLSEWAADEDLPIERLANYQRLVHPGWIYSLARGKHPIGQSGRGSVLFEVGWREYGAYNRGHIPGAGYFDTTEIETEPLWNRDTDKALEATLLAHGVAHDTTVVLYGREPAAVARVAVVLMYAGVQDVRLLDGGFEAWTSAGHEIETQTHAPVPVHAFGKSIPAHPEYMSDMDEVRAILTDEEAVLVSVRSWPEYTGQTSGYDFIEPRGRIAGAVWGHAASAPDRMDHLRNVDNTMRSYHEIAENWRGWGIIPEKKICFYCGTGWRASEAFFYAYLMGWQRISVYDGGWYEWSADPSNPVESGEPVRPQPSAPSTLGA